MARSEVTLPSHERPVVPDRLSRRRVVATVLALAWPACRGEGRPNVEVIGGAETVSVSELAPDEVAAASGGTPASQGGTPAAGGVYAVGTNDDIYFAMG